MNSIWMTVAAFSIAACSDAAPVADAGRGDDAGRRDAGARDAGRDDAGGDDAGRDDAGGSAPQSMITVMLTAGPVTFGAVDEGGAPLVFQAGASFDGDGDGSEEIYTVSGVEMYSLDVTSRTFRDPVELVDDRGMPFAPATLFAGALGTGAPLFIGTSGTNARVYDFARHAFGPPLALVEVTDMMGTTTPFEPEYAAFVNYRVSVVAAFRTGTDPGLYILDPELRFVNALPMPRTCVGATDVDASILVSARVSGSTDDRVLFIAGSSAYLLSLEGSICLEPAPALQDESGAPIEPRLAFPADFNGDGTDEVIYVH